MPMRVLQICLDVNFGDGVGNHAIGMKKAITEAGYDTELYANSIDGRLPVGAAKKIDEMPRVEPADILIYHMCTWTPLNMQWLSWGGKKVMLFHNITPGKFYDPYNSNHAKRLRQAKCDVKRICNKVDHCIALSEYSKNTLIDMGYSESIIDVMPGCFIPFEDYAQEADLQTLDKYSDGWTNILFVGRVVPNKKQEDIIQIFAYYKEHINPESRLILIGSESSAEYVNAIKEYVRELEIQDVIFVGHISIFEIIALYKCAHVFLCMSEYEGFCIPIVEAMYFEVPIIAYSATAVPETLGGSSLVVDSKDPPLVAKLIDRVVRNQDLRELLINQQNNRLKAFENHVPANWLNEYLYRIINTR